MPTTMQTLLDALKESYQYDVNQLNNTTALLNWAEKDDKNIDVVGRRAYHTIRYVRSGGVGAGSIVNGTLPTAGSMTRKNLLVPLRAIYGRFQFDDSVQFALQDRGGFVDLLTEQAELVEEFRRDVNRQLFGTSDGVLAACAATSNSSTVQLAASTTPTQLRHLAPHEGMRLSIGTVANPTAVAQNLRIVSVNAAAKTVNIVDFDTGAAVNVTTTTAHRFFRQGAGGAGTFTGDVGDGQYELTGLQTIVGTGTLFGINPANVYSVWQSFVDSNGGTLRAISAGLINNALVQTATNAPDQPIEVLIVSPELGVKVMDLLVSERRQVNTVELRGGVRAIEWAYPSQLGAGETPLVGIYWEPDCPGHTMFGISAGALKWYTMGDMHWMDLDGAIFSRVKDKPAYEAAYACYCEFAPVRRNSMFAIRDLQQ